MYWLHRCWLGGRFTKKKSKKSKIGTDSNATKFEKDLHSFSFLLKFPKIIV